MAALGAQTIASSYEQLLHTDTDGGGNGNTLVTIKDGDNGTTFGLKLATNKVEIIPGSDDANAFEVSQADGTAVFTVNTSSPAFTLTGNATITTADNTDTLTLISTDADANVGPNINLYRNSGSPADSDYIGTMAYVGRNDNSQDVNYVKINVQANDVSDGTEDGTFIINTMRAGALDQTFNITPTEVIINEDSKDVDFRVESNGNANMLFVDAGNNRVGIGEASPTDPLHVKTTAVETRISLESSTGKWAIGAEDNDKFGILNYGTSTPFIIDSSGKVGIGTTSPTGKLSLAGASGVGANVYLDNHTADADACNIIFRKSRNATVGSHTSVNSADSLGVIYFQGSDGNSYETGATIRATADEAWSGSALGAALTFHTVDNTTTTLDERMRIDHNGFIGIGEVAPQKALHITKTDDCIIILDGNGTSTDKHIVMAHEYGASSGHHWSMGVDQSANSGAGQFVIAYDANSQASFTDDDFFNITSTGLVGINTASPETAIHVRNVGSDVTVQANASSGVAYFRADSGAGTNAGLQMLEDGTTRWGIFNDGDNSDKLTFEDQDGHINMTIQQDGKVGIGVTDPECELEIKGGTLGKKLFLEHTSSTATDCYGMEIKFSAAAPDDNTRYFLNCDDNSHNKCIIWSDGDVNNADNAYGSLSDQRIKQGIRDANSQWDDIKAIKVRNFKKNHDVIQYGDKAWEQIGVIAQELEEAGMDKLVREHPALESEIANSEDINEGDMVKSVQYSIIYMKAIKALQEAMTKIETLEAKVKALEDA